MSPDPSSLTPAEAFNALEQAARCRRLAHSVTDQRTLEALREMASEYEERAKGTIPAEAFATHGRIEIGSLEARR
jgi:hypothetical protein